MLTAREAGSRWLIPAFEQSPRNHLRLDLRRAFENIKYAGVAEHARYWIFEREAVPAMNLQGVVGRRPRDTRAEKLGHAGLEVAALPLVLRAPGEIGDLAGDVNLDRHHCELVRDARKVDQCFSAFYALPGGAGGGRGGAPRGA